MSSLPTKIRPRFNVEQLEDRLMPDATSFVTSLYSNLLNRAPEQAGLNHWVAQINNGESYHDVANEIWRSAEHRGIEVDHYYQSYFQRTADSAGRSFWIQYMLVHTNPEASVESAFLNSAEFVLLHPTASSFINGLYLDVLGRVPSISETLAWENTLAAFGSAAVVQDILGSAESAGRIVTDDYVAYLNRQPDSSGLSSWTNQLLSGTGTINSVAVGILGSPEYAASH